MKDMTKLKAIHMIVNNYEYDSDTKVDLVKDLLNQSPYEKEKRVDPPTCGCTDCITGYSRPAVTSSEYFVHQFIWNEENQ